jgi:hypothetical protein
MRAWSTGWEAVVPAPASRPASQETSLEMGTEVFMTRVYQTPERDGRGGPHRLDRLRRVSCG